jgi:subtilisin-like proprotein convertase family protein
VDPATACGTTLSLPVAISSAEGAWSRTFSPLVGTPATTLATIPSADVPKAITDNATAVSTIAVPPTAAVQDVDVTLTLTHSYDADLDISLVGPNGARVDLSSDNGGSGDHYSGTTFDDEAASGVTAGAAPFSGSFRPEAPLSVFDGIPANGTWRLEIFDDAGSDTGQLTAWSLVLTTAAPPVCNVCAGPPGPPGEAGASSPLLVSRSGADLVLDWGYPPNPCSPTAFSVYRGDLATLAAGAYSHDTQLACGVGSATHRLAVDDARLGDAAYFLVSSENGLAEGSYGRASSGGERPASGQACRAEQDRTSCP